MRLSLVRVALVRQIRFEAATGAIPQYLFCPSSQRAAAVVAEFQASKQATMAVAAAARHGAEVVRRAVREAKETTAALSLTLSRHSLAPAAAALALLAIMAVPCAELAVTV
jgi:hypothetical protein